MRRVGLFGGTFNPIHVGHLAVAQMAQEAMKLDKIIFIPSNWPPHKHADVLAPARHRYNMVRLAIANNPAFEISDYEICKEGKSYTIDTLRDFRRIYPKETRLFFIIGGDTLPQLKTWKYIDSILTMATFIVVNRPGQFKKSTGIKKIKYYAVSMQGIDISSSYIRRRIRTGKTVRYYVFDQVLRYIQKCKLYQ